LKAGPRRSSTGQVDEANPNSNAADYSYNFGASAARLNEPFNNQNIKMSLPPKPLFEAKLDPMLTLPPVKSLPNPNLTPSTMHSRTKVESLLDHGFDNEHNINLFPKIIVNPEDTKLSTLVNPNLVTTHEIKTTPISSLQSQLPIDQKDHLPPPVYEEFIHPKSKPNYSYVNVGDRFKYPNNTTTSGLSNSNHIHHALAKENQEEPKPSPPP